MNVVVAFYSLDGATEKLALAAAVGAVQGRANIRLRRLPVIATEAATPPPDSESAENRTRMAWEYIAPKETDTTWADAIILAIPSRLAAASPPLLDFCESLRTLRTEGKLHAKLTAFLCDSHRLGETALAELGFEVVPLGLAKQEMSPLDRARLLGRRVAESQAHAGATDLS